MTDTPDPEQVSRQPGHTSTEAEPGRLKRGLLTRVHTFASLGLRNYRLLWLGQISTRRIGVPKPLFPHAPPPRRPSPPLGDRGPRVVTPCWAPRRRGENTSEIEPDGTATKTTSASAASPPSRPSVVTLWPARSQSRARPP